jgi:hypothetical protein
MSKLSFSLKTLLLAIAVVAVYFPLREIYDSWRRHRLQETHQIFSDYETLAILNEGDSVQDVTRHYPMLSAVEPNTPAWDNIANGFQSAKLSVEATDAFYQYTLNEEGMYGYLHFRNGKLINHPKDVFADPVANAIRSGVSLPGFFDRMGFFPIYFATIALACTIFFVGKRFIRKLRPSAVGNRNNQTTKLPNGG